MALIRCWGCDFDVDRILPSFTTWACATSGGPINNGPYWYASTDGTLTLNFGAIVEGGVAYWCQMSDPLFQDNNNQVSLYDDATQVVLIDDTGTTYDRTVTVGGANAGYFVRPWPYDSFIYYQLTWKIDAATGYIRLYQWDGGVRSMVYEFTGDTDQYTTNGSIDQIRFWRDNWGVSVDDVVAWDTTGSVLNSLPSTRLAVETLRPNADTAESDWTPNSGTTNYTQVDEGPVSDGDTTYVESTTTGDRDRYDVGGTALPSGASIVGVQATAIARTTVSGTLKLGVRGPAGTESLSANQTLQTSYAAIYHTVELNPDDSAVWEPSDLANAQIVLEHGT